MSRAMLCSLLALSGCYSFPPGLKERSAAAQAIVWLMLQAPGSPPSIVWRKSDCDGPYGQQGIVVGHGCVGGAYYSNTIELPFPSPAISDTSFSHEHLHAWHWAALGVEDPTHKRSEWLVVPAALNDVLQMFPNVDRGDAVKPETP